MRNGSMLKLKSYDRPHAPPCFRSLWQQVYEFGGHIYIYIYIYILFWLLQWDCNNANGATRMKRTDEQSFPFVWPDPALVLKTVVQAAVEQAKVDHLQI